MTELRKELPPLPERMQRLPVSDRGYPVPWFVQWMDERHEATPVGEGVPEFRVMRRDAMQIAVQQKRCWVCGEPLGVYMAFVAGPMCAVNRTSSEPPSHRDCAIFSAIACPFLTRPHARRREGGAIETLGEDMPGVALLRNPGVALVWITKRYGIYSDGNGGQLFHMGDPTEVLWYAEGREATREQVQHSIDTGLPFLEELIAEEDDKGREELVRMTAEVMDNLAPAA